MGGNLALIPMAVRNSLCYEAAVARLGCDGVRMNDRPSALDSEGVVALAHMEQALELLDRCNDAMDVGAHLDLAICRLREIMESKGIAMSPRDCF